MNDQETLIKNLSQTWPMPSKISPVIIIGTGGIVKDAHLPAYKKAVFNVAGLYYVDKDKSQTGFLLVHKVLNSVHLIISGKLFWNYNWLLFIPDFHKNINI